MKRYDIKACEKVLETCWDGLRWNTMVRYSNCLEQIPAMKPLD